MNIPTYTCCTRRKSPSSTVPLYCAVRMDMEGAERDDIGVIVHNWPCSMLREEQHAAHTLLHM